MTIELRDRIALEVIKPALTDATIPQEKRDIAARAIAEFAYIVADAFLEARLVRQENRDD
jgi:hypothetical protein